MAVRNAAPMSAQNQPIRDYEDAIETFHVHRLAQESHEQEQRRIVGEQMMLHEREMLNRDYQNQTIVPSIPPSGSAWDFYRTLLRPLTPQPLPITYNIGSPQRSSASSSSNSLAEELERMMEAEGWLQPPILPIQDAPPLPQGQNFVSKPKAKIKRRVR